MGVRGTMMNGADATDRKIAVEDLAVSKKQQAVSELIAAKPKKRV